MGENQKIITTILSNTIPSTTSKYNISPVTTKLLRAQICFAPKKMIISYSGLSVSAKTIGHSISIYYSRNICNL